MMIFLYFIAIPVLYTRTIFVSNGRNGGGGGKVKQISNTTCVTECKTYHDNNQFCSCSSVPHTKSQMAPLCHHKVTLTNP